MKLEVGMYIRTNEGYIAKLIGFTQTFNQDGEYDVAYIFDKNIDYYNTDITWYYLEKIMKKASHNIIDLIEVGDYVNGYKVYYCYCADEDMTGLFIDTETKRVWLDKSSQIKTIVTKEQFESMSYKVGE